MPYADSKAPDQLVCHSAHSDLRDTLYVNLYDMMRLTSQMMTVQLNLELQMSCDICFMWCVKG